MTEMNEKELSQYFLEMGTRARQAKRAMAIAPSAQKDEALTRMAELLLAEEAAVLAANARDMEAGRAAGLNAGLLDRLLLTPERLRGIAGALSELIALPDPIGELMGGWQRPNGLEILKKRVPLGVLMMIYESRPNVTIDAAGLAVKTGNAIILKGGVEAYETNLATVAILRQALTDVGLPADAVQFVEAKEPSAVRYLLKMKGYVDVVIPRGGAGLIQFVCENASVPVIETGTGNCHTYVDAGCDLDMALAIAINAKVQRPSVCNAMESLLVHRDAAAEFLPRLAAAMQENGVELRGCERTQRVITDCTPAVEEDWSTEFLRLVLAVKVVDSLDEAIEHINRYSSGHSEAIVTNDLSHARRFQAEIDAAAVYVNASTRFTDGGEFGFGAEIGISTQKLHARGPMGMEALTTVKYVINGSGQIR